MKSKKRLCIEVLEDRNLLNGVTIIAHGDKFSADSPDIPLWVTSMSNEIAKKIASSNNIDYKTIPQFKLEISGSRRIDPYVSGWKYHGDFSSTINPLKYDLKNSFGYTIISIDWSAVAEPGESSTGEIAELVSEYLLNEEWELGKQILSLPIHLVGFSRGGSLIGKLAEELGEQGLFVDHSTYLDDYPYIDDFGFLEFPIKVPSNVIFSDSYYRKHQILSRRVEGTREIDLHDVLKNGAYVDLDVYNKLITGAHSNVHLWYQGTIDNDGNISDGYVNNFDPDEFNWYEEYSRNRDGFALSFLDRTSLPLSGIGENFYFLYGKGKRKTITLGNAWDNIIIIDSGLEKIVEGDEISIRTFFSDKNKDSTVSFGFDSDTNPYNGFIEKKEIKTFNKEGYIIASLNSENIGEWYIYAKIENDNNARFSYSPIKKILSIEAQTTADLFTNFFSAPFDKLSPSQTINVNYELLNQGKTNSNMFDVSFYLSKDHIINSSDLLLDKIRFVNVKAKSSTGIIEKNLKLPEQCHDYWNNDGYYYLGFIIDTENNIFEEIETNNSNRGEGIDYQRITLKDTCPPKPGIIISSTELITREIGATTSFSLKLATEPSSEVKIKLASDNKEGIINPSELTFDSSNWNNPEYVNVTPINDAIKDGDKTYFITVFPAESQDKNYNGLNPEDVFVTNIDQGVSFTNFLIKEDVNNDGIISPIDALLIINHLNRPRDYISPPPFLDVSGDNFITPIDALLVINHINRKSEIETKINSENLELNLYRRIY